MCRKGINQRTLEELRGEEKWKGESKRRSMRWTVEKNSVHKGGGVVGPPRLGGERDGPAFFIGFLGTNWSRSDRAVRCHKYIYYIYYELIPTSIPFNSSHSITLHSGKGKKEQVGTFLDLRPGGTLPLSYVFSFSFISLSHLTLISVNFYLHT